MEMNLMDIELGLNEMLDTCLNYVEDVLIQEEIMEANKTMF